MTTGNNLGPPGPRDDDARPKPGHAEPAATTAPRYRKTNPPPRQCGPDPRPWWRRRQAAQRLVPLDCGCADPWPCRCTQPPLSGRALDGWAAAAAHVLASGQIPLVPIEVRRALWRRGGSDRELAEQLHQLTGGQAA